MSTSNTTKNEKIIAQIRDIANRNKAITFIHNRGISLSIEIVDRGFRNKIDLESLNANSQLTACHLTLQYVDEGMNDYKVTFSPKNKKMYTLQYDVRATSHKLAEEQATKDLSGDGINRFDYKAKAEISLINQARSAA